VHFNQNLFVFKIIVLIFGLLINSISHSQEIRIVAGDHPPLQTQQADGSVNGAMVDVVNLLLKETGVNATIEVYPWARAYQLALTHPNILIISILKSAERVEKFHWIGHLYSINPYLAILNNRTDISINSLEDAKNYRVSTVRNDLAETYLLSKGFELGKNLYVSSKYPTLWRSLTDGKADVVFTNEFLWHYKINGHYLSPEKIRLIYQVPEFSSEVYIAASLATDLAVVEKFTLALNKIKSDGRFNEIMKKWRLAKQIY